MSKRKYSGPPLDGTEQYITEANTNGETIMGKTEDDTFDDRTEILPDDMEEDDLTEMQWDALNAFLIEGDREDPDFRDLAQGEDFSYKTAERAVHKAFRNLRDMDDLSNSQQYAVLVLSYHGMDSTLSELGRKYPVSADTLGKVKNTYPDIVRKTDISKEDLDKYTEQFKEAKRTVSRDSSDDEGDNADKQPGRKAPDEKEWPDDFSEAQRWFIEQISDNPSYTAGEIGATIPTDDSGEQKWSSANFHNNIRQYPELIARLIGEKGAADDVSDLNSYLQEHIPVSVIEDLNGLQASSDPGPDPDNNGSDQTNAGGNDIENRLSAVESKVESLRQELDSVKQSDGNAENTNLAQVVIESLSDEQLGQILRGAMLNE